MARRNPPNKLPDADERDRAIPGNPDPAASSDMATGDDLLPFNVTEDDDGGATLEYNEPEKKPSTFSSNLAEVFDEFVLRDYAIDLLDKIEHDKEARSKRDEQYEEGIRRTGLGDDAPGGATFEGASKAVHPVMAEGCVDFSAATSKELLPAAGPVKTVIRDTITAQQQGQEMLLEKSKRKAEYLNHLMTQGIPEYYPEKKTLFTQLPLGGSQYEKFWPDGNEYHMEFVPVDKVHLPFAATSFYTAGRVTHQLELTEDEFLSRVDSGFYRNIDNLTEENLPQQTKAEEATDKIEGRDPTIYNDDGLRTLYEVTCYLRVKEDPVTKGQRSPYVITIDEPTNKVVAWYRNWKENDPKRAKLDWWVEDRFITWRGAYGIGLPHLIGSMSGAITGALRALLDSAHVNNTPALLKGKAGRMSGTNTVVDPVGVTEIDMGTVDDIRKLAMAMPYNPPSPVLFQLMEFLVQSAKQTVATAEEKIADASNSMPVGTALALIEQGSKVFSSIHQGLHFSQKKGIDIVCRMVHDYPNVEELQRYGLTPDDFADNSDIDPVSDPNIFSEAQRFAQWQAVMQMAQDPQGGFDKRTLYRRGLELLRWPDIDAVLPPPPKPVTADPVTENQAALLQGVPLQAQPQQDHLAHLIEHIRVLLDPLIGAGPLFQGPQLMPILQHCGQHMAMWYKAEVFKHSANLGVQAAMNGMPEGKMNPDQIAAQAAMMAQKEIMSGPVGQHIQNLQKAAQIVQGKMPPQPMDPGSMQLQIEKLNNQEAMQRLQADTQKSQQDFQISQGQLWLDSQRVQNEAQIAQQTLAQELAQQHQKFQEDMVSSRQEFMLELAKFKQEQKEADDNFLLQLTKLAQENQQGQADLAQREVEIGQRLGAVEKAVNTPPEVPDVTPHLQAIADTQAKTHEGLQQLAQGLAALHAQTQKRPNKIVRDANGDAVGMTYDPSLENNNG